MLSLESSSQQNKIIAQTVTSLKDDIYTKCGIKFNDIINYQKQGIGLVNSEKSARIIQVGCLRGKDLYQQVHNTDLLKKNVI